MDLLRLGRAVGTTARGREVNLVPLDDTCTSQAPVQVV